MTPLKNSLVARFCIKVFGFLPYAMEKIQLILCKFYSPLLVYCTTCGGSVNGKVTHPKARRAKTGGYGIISLNNPMVTYHGGKLQEKEIGKMFYQPSTTVSILPIVSPSVTQNPKVSSYSWKTWAKTGLVFATTTGAFLILKTTGAFAAFTMWFKSSEENRRSEEDTALVANTKPGFTQNSIKSGTTHSFDLVALQFRQ
jgi:hypothetical protein